MARDSGIDTDLLNAALVGYQVQRDRLAAMIADIQDQLGHRGRSLKSETSGSEEPARHRRGMSDAGKARIAAAQRKRWAKVKAAKGESEKPKRRLSAAGRARIIAATKARWDAFRQAKAQKPAAKKALRASKKSK
jgi:hypothetical protein